MNGDEKASSPASDPPSFGKDGYYGDFSPDAEKGGIQGTPLGPGGRKMSRIDRPVTKSITSLDAPRGSTSPDDVTDPSISVGKQMEMEAGNAIKYRTCSWQKV